MKTLLALIISIMTFSLCAEKTSVKNNIRNMSAAERQLYRERVTGGFVVKPNTQKGKIVFYDMQKTLASSNITSVINMFKADRNGDYNFIVKNSNFDSSIITDCSAFKRKIEADILIVIRSDDKSPTIVTAPEDGWTIINTAKIIDGLKNSAFDKFAESRYRKELIRAVCYAVGTPVTQFKGNIFTIAKARDLDHCPEMIPIDTMQRTAFRLKDLGVMPSYKTTYRKACVDGWAPAPTNEYQKAIWDKVHAMPTAPIKIKPETKKVQE